MFGFKLDADLFQEIDGQYATRRDNDGVVWQDFFP
jgi:hypothetical protein